MYGAEYLDWVAEEKAAHAIDGFLAAMEPEDRKWALAVLRKRHVTYRDGSPLQNLVASHQRNFSRGSQIYDLLDAQRNAASSGPLSFLGL